MKALLIRTLVVLVILTASSLIAVSIGVGMEDTVSFGGNPLEIYSESFSIRDGSRSIEVRVRLGEPKEVTIQAGHKEILCSQSINFEAMYICLRIR